MMVRQQFNRLQDGAKVRAQTGQWDDIGGHIFTIGQVCKDLHGQVLTVVGTAETGEQITFDVGDAATLDCLEG